MPSFFVYYAESNIVCLIIFGIMLIHDLFSIDRQEKQIKYDHVLIAFMCYFLSDTFWAATVVGFIPKTQFVFVVVNLANYIIMVAITYSWLRYVMAVEQAPNRERRINKFAVIFPFLIATIALIIVYFAAPQFLFNENLELQPGYQVFLVAVPYIYIIAVIIYAMRQAKKEKNPIERRKHFYLAFFPLMVVAGGIAQMILPYVPIFCFACTLLMLIFYIQSMEVQISMDPLTRLNNRGQLIRYISQESNSRQDERLTFVIMIDINDFKMINDRFGHAEGDNALIIIADSLRAVVRKYRMPIFLGRYGGDEFVLIVHLLEERDVASLIQEVRSQIEMTCRSEETPYLLSIGAGYDQLRNGSDTLQMCIQRADQKMYLDKEDCKRNGRSSVCL
ncbi:MAG: GGDEF domain-containing protein [Parasporobacterium sp.]|nr:GGDEF domain-containing protein [Parasporobacterium sp.]